MAGVCSAPAASVCRALPRGSALGAAPTPGDWPRFPEYVVARRYAVSGTAPNLIGAGGSSNGARHCFTAQRSHSRSFVLATLRALHPESDLPRPNHWHLSGWTEQSVESPCALGAS